MCVVNKFAMILCVALGYPFLGMAYIAVWAKAGALLGAVDLGSAMGVISLIVLAFVVIIPWTKQRFINQGIIGK